MQTVRVWWEQGAVWSCGCQQMGGGKRADTQGDERRTKQGNCWCCWEARRKKRRCCQMLRQEHSVCAPVRSGGCGRSDSVWWAAAVGSAETASDSARSPNAPVHLRGMTAASNYVRQSAGSRYALRMGNGERVAAGRRVCVCVCLEAARAGAAGHGWPQRDTNSDADVCGEVVSAEGGV